MLLKQVRQKKINTEVMTNRFLLVVDSNSIFFLFPQLLTYNSTQVLSEDHIHLYLQVCHYFFLKIFNKTKRKKYIDLKFKYSEQVYLP